jgi:hypothetical protein
MLLSLLFDGVTTAESGFGVNQLSRASAKFGCPFEGGKIG